MNKCIPHNVRYINKETINYNKKINFMEEQKHGSKN